MRAPGTVLGIVLTSLGITLSAARMCAQPPTPATAGAIALLGDPDPGQRAWGAYRAECQGDRALAPHLRNALAALRGDGPDVSLARRVVLGALIELGVEVPAAELRRLAPAHPTAVLVLAARDPAANAGVLDGMLDLPLDDLQWTAACELLATGAATELVTRLLRQLDIALHLHVTDREATFHAGGSWTSRHADGHLAVPAEFPPVPLYILEQGGEKPIAQAPYPVSVRRTLILPGTTAGAGGSSRPEHRDDRRLKMLAQLLGADAVAGLHPRVDRTLRFRNDRQLLRDARDQRRTLAAAWRRMRSCAVEAGLLSEDAAGALPPRITTTLHDHRHGGAALPELPAGSADVRIGGIDWYTDYAAALEVARATDRPLLLHFGENPG